MTTHALDAINRVDDGLTLPGDEQIAAVFDKHASPYWDRIDVQLDRWAADRCVICGATGQGPECDSCLAGWDFEVARSADV